MHGNKELEILLSKGYESSVADGIRELVGTLDKNAALAADFDPLAEDYAKHPEQPISEVLEKIAKVGKKHGVNEYSLDLLLVINGLPYIHEKFREKGLSDDVFYETMDDIRCKTLECIECKGVVGTFVAGWYDRFFRGECFGFGRFQYEFAVYNEDTDFVMSCGKVLKKGDKYVNMHIPSRGIPLTDEVRFASYRAAYEYFKPYFESGVVIFGCHSWLLYDKHLQFLPQNMNIRKFISDFELVYSVETEEFDDIWRVFGRYANRPYNELPRDTALRKAYAEWLCAGNRSGVGLGVFAFDGEKII